jgi:hypothetical protein
MHHRAGAYQRFNEAVVGRGSSKHQPQRSMAARTQVPIYPSCFTPDHPPSHHILDRHRAHAERPSRGAGLLGNAPLLELYFPTNEFGGFAPRPGFFTFWKMMRPCAVEGDLASLGGTKAMSWRRMRGPGIGVCARVMAARSGPRWHVTGGIGVGARVNT